MKYFGAALVLSLEMIYEIPHQFHYLLYENFPYHYYFHIIIINISILLLL